MSYYLALALAFVSSIGLASPDMFLWNEPSSLAMFYYADKQPLNIQAMRIYFFAHPSCYQDYMQDIQFTTHEQELWLEGPTYFSLSSKASYRLAKWLLTPQELNHLASILIDIKDGPKNVLAFEGPCADQGIHCCLQLRCDTSQEDCRFEYKPPTVLKKIKH